MPLLVQAQKATEQLKSFCDKAKTAAAEQGKPVMTVLSAL
jgi:hypothetical protein